MSGVIKQKLFRSYKQKEILKPQITFISQRISFQRGNEYPDPKDNIFKDAESVLHVTFPIIFHYLCAGIGHASLTSQRLTLWMRQNQKISWDENKQINIYDYFQYSVFIPRSYICVSNLCLHTPQQIYW